MLVYVIVMHYDLGNKTVIGPEVEHECLSLDSGT